MKSLHKLNCLVLLLATSLCKTTAAQVIPIEPSPPDVLLSTLPPSPAFPFPPPVVDVQRTYDELLQQAREMARAEFEEERAQWQVVREGGGGDEGRKDQEMKVVRETFYVPLPRQEASPSPEAVADERASTAGVASAVVKPLEEAADIVKTVGKLKALKPVFKYAIHHPLRFLYRYALVPLFHLLLFLLANIFSILLYLLSTALSPLNLVLSVLLAPLFSLYHLNLALLPLYYTLIGALLAGSALGAVAGVVAGRTTREIIDEAVWRTKKSLIWVGVLPKEPAREEKKAPGGYGPGARLETLAGVFGSSRARAQDAEKEKKRRSKGKERAFASPLADDDEDGLATPPGHFNPIHLSSSSNRRPVAVLASESNPFPSHISTSLAQRRHEEKAYPPPPRFVDPEEAEDPPSEELAGSNPAGVRVGEDGGVSGKAKVMATASGDARGWREREVDF